MNCFSCGLETAEGIKCQSDHFLCKAPCFQLYFETEFISEKSVFTLPLKCSCCNSPYDKDEILTMMNEQQTKTYIKLEYETNLKEGQILMNCPSCAKGVIFNKEEIPHYLICSDYESYNKEVKTCDSVVCTICFIRVQFEDQEEGLEEIEAKKLKIHSQDDETHAKCREFGALKNEFEEIFVQGLLNKCPNCKFSGQKDQNCCHMSCPKCFIDWCYICEQQLDQNAHFDDWENNDESCPQYLNYINASGRGDFPDDPLSSVEFYHYQKLMKLLKDKILEVGNEKITQLVQIFPMILGGNTIDGINSFKFDSFMIQRFGYK